MPTAELLAAHGTVHVPDLPGFGKSDDPAHVLTVPQLSDALAEWMVSNDIPPAILVGNSLGGQIIAEFASRHGGLLDAAVLVGPTMDPAYPRAITQVYHLAVDIFREPGRLVALGVLDYLRAGFLRCLRSLGHALAHPVEEVLPLIRVPVLIVRGGRDPIVSQEWVEKAALKIPWSRLILIPDAAHAVNFNSPDLLVREILDFLSFVENAGKS
ncbi:MAG: alpha/beta hydrolase [Verrucomicrobiaceae bacterium]|nr:MAG: alpha/beta hydrolase [Verrucomicrobiaceae bacterium]